MYSVMYSVVCTTLYTLCSVFYKTRIREHITEHAPNSTARAESHVTCLARVVELGYKISTEYSTLNS